MIVLWLLKERWKQGVKPFLTSPSLVESVISGMRNYRDFEFQFAIFRQREDVKSTILFSKGFWLALKSSTVRGNRHIEEPCDLALTMPDGSAVCNERRKVCESKQFDTPTV